MNNLIAAKVILVLVEWALTGLARCHGGNDLRRCGQQASALVRPANNDLAALAYFEHRLGALQGQERRVAERHVAVVLLRRLAERPLELALSRRTRDAEAGVEFSSVYRQTILRPPFPLNQKVGC